MGSGSLLPKKDWHTGNSENKERVRKDELEAKIAQETAKKEQILLENSKRLAYLREKAFGKRIEDSSCTMVFYSGEKTATEKEKELSEAYERSFDTPIPKRQNIPWYAANKTQPAHSQAKNHLDNDPIAQKSKGSIKKAPEAATFAPLDTLSREKRDRTSRLFLKFSS